MPEYDQAELDLFARWMQDAGQWSVLNAIQRWRDMEPKSRAALLKRWEAEDAAKGAVSTNASRSILHERAQAGGQS